MLSRAFRLTRAEIEAVRVRGRVLHGAFFTLRTLPAVKSGAAAVVSKKVVRTAVGRHFIRRRLLHLLRVTLPLFQEPQHVVLFAKPGIVEAEFVTISASLAGLLKAAKLVP